MFTFSIKGRRNNHRHFPYITSGQRYATVHLQRGFIALFSLKKGWVGLEKVSRTVKVELGWMRPPKPQEVQGNWVGRRRRIKEKEG